MAFKFNHLLVMTKHLAATEKFFCSLTNFKAGPRPQFPFAGTWLYADTTPIIHLSQASAQAGEYVGHLGHSDDTYVDHIAFSGDDRASFAKTLNRLGYSHIERVVPESGEHQIFVHGPGRLKLEFIFR